MGYRLNRLDEPVLIAVSKPLLTEFGIHHGLESCAVLLFFMQPQNCWPVLCPFSFSGFLFVWILMMALVATPLLFLQVWVGSFSGRSCLGVWKAVPLLKGLGVVQLALSCVQAFYYLITGSLAFYYVGQVIASGDTAFEDCLVSQPRAESCQVSQHGQES